MSNTRGLEPGQRRRHKRWLRKLRRDKSMRTFEAWDRYAWRAAWWRVEQQDVADGKEPWDDVLARFAGAV